MERVSLLISRNSNLESGNIARLPRTLTLVLHPVPCCVKSSRVFSHGVALFKFEVLNTEYIPLGGLEGQKSDPAYNEAVDDCNWRPDRNGDAFATLSSVHCGLPEDSLFYSVVGGGVGFVFHDAP